MSMIALLKIPKIFTHLKRLINLKDKRFGLVTSRYHANIPKFL